MHFRNRIEGWLQHHFFILLLAAMVVPQGSPTGSLTADDIRFIRIPDEKQLAGSCVQRLLNMREGFGIGFWATDIFGNEDACWRHPSLQIQGVEFFHLVFFRTVCEDGNRYISIFQFIQAMDGKFLKEIIIKKFALSLHLTQVN